MRQQRHAPAFELAQQFEVAYQAIDAELDHGEYLESRSVELDHKAASMVEIGFLRGMLERPV
jgi:hypothetical protein